jgi:hypothetical protein
MINISITTNNIESLLLEKTTAAVYNLSKKQFFQILKILHEYDSIREPSSIHHISKDISSISFIIRDIYKYLSTKASNNTYMYIIKNELQIRARILKKIGDLKKFLFNN